MRRALPMLLLAPLSARATNVLIIVADDLGADKIALFTPSDDPDPSAVDATPTTADFQPATPTIDALAAAGLRFTNAWANPACSPTRASLLTGDYAFHHGVGGVIGDAASVPDLSTTSSTLVDDLPRDQPAALFGKWHLGEDTGGTVWDSAEDCRRPLLVADAPAPIDHGFVAYTGGLAGEPEDYTNWQMVAWPGARHRSEVCMNTEEYPDIRTRQEAVAWIGAQSGHPWLAMVMFNAPHNDGGGGHAYWEVDDLSPACPLVASRFAGCFAATPADGCASRGDGCDFDGDGQPHYDCTTRARDMEDAALQQYALYQLLAECMDADVGTLLADIEALDGGAALSDTLILFVGDNGTPGNVIEGPYAAEGSSVSDAGKTRTLESGIRVPLVLTEGATWFGGAGTWITAPNREVSRSVHIVDIRETIDAVVNGRATDTSDGESFRRCFTDTTRNCGYTSRRPLWSELYTYSAAGNLTSGQAAYRSNLGKLVLALEEDHAGAACMNTEAFDLVADPYETTPLTSGGSDHRLRAAVDTWVTGGTGPTWLPTDGLGVYWCP